MTPTPTNSTPNLQAALSTSQAEVARLREAAEALVADVENGWNDPHTLRHAKAALRRGVADE